MSSAREATGRDAAGTPSSGTGCTLDARALGYRYRATRPRNGAPRGVHDIDLSAAAGEIIGVLGPNGAGKSTLLRLLATAVPPHAGTLRVLGVNARGPVRAVRRKIGFAEDGAVHFDGLSGEENALAFARAAGMTRAAAHDAVASLLARFELADRAASPVRSYSHGMRRKLLLVEAFAHVPALVLLDEPTLGLDEPARKVLAGLVRQRAAEGATIVIATHDLEFAGDVCTRVVFLRDGRVVLAGEPAALLRRVDHRTVVRATLRTGAAAAPRFEGPGRLRLGTDGTTIELHTPADATVLPAFCAALLEQNVPIRAISVRSADLRDVFVAVTGEQWSEEP